MSRSYYFGNSKRKVRALAKRLITKTHKLHFHLELDICCLDCETYPVEPVTGSCGHTSCKSCIERRGSCLCGGEPPKELQVNFLVRDLLEIMWESHDVRRIEIPQPNNENQLSIPSTSNGPDQKQPAGSTEILSQCPERAEVSAQHFNYRYKKMSISSRMSHAKLLMCQKKYLKAATHLTIIAAACHKYFSKKARKMLYKALSALSQRHSVRSLEKRMSRAINETSCVANLKLSDLECVICTDVLQHPITTPCGHTFCRKCVNRNANYGNRCALCSRSLRAFSTDEIYDTEFITLVSLMMQVSFPDVDLSDHIYIITSVVAYPEISCPMIIDEQRHKDLFDIIMKTGSRQFGMVPYVSGDPSANFGTFVEIRDCVQLGDGSLLISTIGVGRFKVLDCFYANGYRMGKVETLSDNSMTEEGEIQTVQTLAHQIKFKLRLWLCSMEPELTDIETRFATAESNGDWWNNPHGPTWLWYVISLLPLKTDIQMILVFSNELKKRMLALSRILDNLYIFVRI